MTPETKVQVDAINAQLIQALQPFIGKPNTPVVVLQMQHCLGDLLASYRAKLPALPPDLFTVKADGPYSLLVSWDVERIAKDYPELLEPLAAMCTPAQSNQTLPEPT